MILKIISIVIAISINSGMASYVEPTRSPTKYVFLVSELATLDDKLTSSCLAEPYARFKLKPRTGGEKGRHL